MADDPKPLEPSLPELVAHVGKPQTPPALSNEDRVMAFFSNQLNGYFKEAGKQSEATAKVELEAARMEMTDRERERTHERQTHWVNSAVFLVVLLSLLGVVVYSLARNKDALATELVRTVITLLAGGAAGYGIGAQKKSSKRRSDEDDD